MSENFFCIECNQEIRPIIYFDREFKSGIGYLCDLCLMEHEEFLAMMDEKEDE